MSAPAKLPKSANGKLRPNSVNSTDGDLASILRQTPEVVSGFGRGPGFVLMLAAIVMARPGMFAIKVGGGVGLAAIAAWAVKFAH